jgi:hypothetical protein
MLQVSLPTLAFSNSHRRRMREWMPILELENWRVRSLLLVPLGLKFILNYKPVLMVGSIQPSG